MVGTTLSLAGSYLDDIQCANLSMNAIPLDGTSVKDTDTGRTLDDCAIPAGLSGGTEYDISIDTADCFTSDATTEYGVTITCTMDTVKVLVVPEIDSISPSSGDEDTDLAVVGTSLVGATCGNILFDSTDPSQVCRCASGVCCF